MTSRLIAFLVLLGMAMPLIPTDVRAQAQSWLPATNLSSSGGAAGALLALGSDDTAYAAWWDVADGLRYAVGRIDGRTVDWSEARVAPGVDGGQDLRDSQRPRTLAPRRPSLFVGGTAAHYVYFTDDGRLMDARFGRTRRDVPSVVAEDAVGVAGTVDLSGTLHLAYAVGSSDAEKTGIYYSRRTETPSAVLITASPYLRGVPLGDVQIDVAVDGVGGVMVVWRQRVETRGSYAISTDSGRSWSEPREIAPRSGLLGAQSFVSVTSPEPGRFLLLWRDIGAPGCGLVQKETSDAGATWSIPQRVMEDASPCPSEWRLMRNAAAAWLVGAVQGGRFLLAAWDGQRWARIGTITLNSLDRVDAAGGSLLGFSCLGAALGGERLGLIGCDARGDVVAVVGSGPASAFVEDVRNRWIELRTSFVFGAPPRSLATAQGARGEAFAAWTSGRTVNDDTESVLVLSMRSDGNWSPPSWTLGADGSRAQVTSLRRPALAVTDHRVHVVWQGGRSGGVYYSSAALRDAATRDGWSAPMALPAPSLVGGAPAIAVDPWSGALLVMYAVSYNEGRGLYVVRSEDDGATWRAPRRVVDAAAWPAVDDVQIVVDRRTREWHAIFVRLDSADGSGQSTVYHAHSVDGGVTWGISDVVVAEGELRDPRLLVADGGRVVVVWNRMRPAGVEEEAAPYETWSRISGDGGRTWAVRLRVPGFGAVCGAPALLFDGDRVILSAIGETSDRAAVMLTSELDDKGWSVADAAPLHRPAAVGSSLALLRDEQAGVVQAVLRSAALQADGALRMRIDVLQRRFAGTAASSLPALPTTTAESASSKDPIASLRALPMPTTTVIVLPMDQRPSTVTQASLLGPALIGAIAAIALAAVILRLTRR